MGASSSCAVLKRAREHTLNSFIWGKFMSFVRWLKMGRVRFIALKFLIDTVLIYPQIAVLVSRYTADNCIGTSWMWTPAGTGFAAKVLHFQCCIFVCKQHGNGDAPVWKAYQAKQLTHTKNPQNPEL